MANVRAMYRILLITMCVAPLVSSANDTSIALPETSSISSAVVNCYGDRMQVSSESASNLLSFLNSVNNGWVSWGFNTPPAGDIGVTFRLRSGKEFRFFTWRDFHSVGGDFGKRTLSALEAKQLTHLIPPRCVNRGPKNAL